MGIRINGSSGGYVEIDVPANPSNRNITLPDTDGEALVGTTNGSVVLPSGTTAQRPTGAAGQIRFNTDTGEMEFWSSTSAPAQWRKVRDGELPAFSVRYLIAAGGGAGGSSHASWVAGGGGGAGGLLTASNDTSTFSLNTSYTVTVGAGGARTVGTSTYRNAGNNGANSVLHTLTAIGGGGGGGGQMANYTLAEAHGKDGGSGGGTSGYGNYGTGSLIGSGTAGQGNDGGGPTSNPNYAGGGGGGAGSAGVAASSSLVSLDTGGNGGDGVSDDITGTAVIYCAGGGGGTYSTTNTAAQGKGGSNGAGGRGGFNYYGTAYAGGGNYSDRTGQTPGSGGGGGGGWNGAGSWAFAAEYDGGAGADGRVIIRINSAYSATFTGVTVTTTTVDDDTVYECTGGTGTVTFALA